MRKVLVTGLGAVSPLGGDLPSTFSALLQGRSAVGEAPPRVQRWLPDALAATVPPGFETRLGRTDRGLDRASQFALLAAREAIQDAQLELDDAGRERAGVYAGIGMGGACSLDAMYARFYNRVYHGEGETGDPVVVHPMSVPTTMANAPVAWLSIELKLRGPTQTFSVACASSAVALGEACRAIRHGYADTIVVVGTEAMLALGPFLGWHALRVMAPRSSHGIAASCRPFSRDRAGFVLGEGAAAVVLESEERVRASGRRAYAELAGYGCSSDATHITQPCSSGQARALRAALDDAACNADDVGYVNAHGTATEAGDLSETQAIKAVFQSHASQLAVSSTKSMHGHLIGAAGAMEFAITVKALREGVLPPTAHLHEPDPLCDLDCVPLVARERTGLRAAVSNSFAFGGTNVSLVARALH
jgi:3-oxoacyl-[acyl-carrier-protein] synthase II